MPLGGWRGSPPTPQSGKRNFSNVLNGTNRFHNDAAIDGNGLGNVDPAYAGQHHFSPTTV
jgi:hypothetical protein